MNNYTYHIWDTGSGKFSGLGEGYYIGSKGAIIFCDPYKEKSVFKVRDYIEGLQEKAPGIPTVICLTKMDLKIEQDLDLLDEEKKGWNEKPSVVGIYNISNKTGHNIHEALKCLDTFI